MALISMGMVVLAVLSWKQHYWSPLRQDFYSFTAGIAIAYTLLLAQAGQLTVFL